MTPEQEESISKLMATLYVNTMSTIEKFARQDLISAELGAYAVKNIAEQLIHLAQAAQETEKD
jgi:hypothetical protein